MAAMYPNVTVVGIDLAEPKLLLVVYFNEREGIFYPFYTASRRPRDFFRYHTLDYEKRRKKAMLI